MGGWGSGTCCPELRRAARWAASSACSSAAVLNRLPYASRSRCCSASCYAHGTAPTCTHRAIRPSRHCCTSPANPRDHRQMPAAQHHGRCTEAAAWVATESTLKVNKQKLSAHCSPDYDAWALPGTLTVPNTGPACCAYQWCSWGAINGPYRWAVLADDRQQQHLLGPTRRCAHAAVPVTHHLPGQGPMVGTRRLQHAPKQRILDTRVLAGKVRNAELGQHTNEQRGLQCMHRAWCNCWLLGPFPLGLAEARKSVWKRLFRARLRTQQHRRTTAPPES